MDYDQRIVLEDLDTARPAAEAGRTEIDEESFEPLEPAPPVPAPQPRPRRRMLLAGLLGIGTLALLQFTLQLWESAKASPLLGGAWLLAWLLLLAGSARVAAGEWQRLRRMRNQQSARERAEAMLRLQGVGQAEAFCAALARAAGQDASAAYQRFLGQLQATHNNREVLELYSRSVLAEADASALQRVTKHAGDTAVMIAFSQFALFDMLLIFWRNLRMIEDISSAYAIELGYWGRIRMLRGVLQNVAYAGAAEVASEVGLEMSGAGVTGKVSASLAQGIGAGLLTARLGLRTMDACRPIPWSPGQRPTLGAVRRQVRAELGRFLGNL